MTSKIRVEEIVDLIDFLCICGFPEEFEIMGRLIVDKLSYVSDFSMDNGKAKEWSGAILYLIAKESGLFKMSEVRKNDESTFMLYNKALYYHICNDEVNANLYIQKAFEKNNIVPKYILDVEDKSFEEGNVTDFMGGVKSIYIEGSKEEALVKIYLTHQMMMKIKI